MTNVPLGNNNVRTICYIAGSDNGGTLDTSYSQKSFFYNMIGAMTITGARCQVDGATSATIQVFKNNLGTAITASTVCSTAPPSWTTPTLSSTALAVNESLDLSITAVSGTPHRLTVCLAATVN
jgi:hypothetical protein